jgi:hypothetical protein
MAGVNLKTTRQRLPNRRGGVMFAEQADSLNFSITPSRYRDSSFGGTFLQDLKVTS